MINFKSSIKETYSDNNLSLLNAIVIDENGVNFKASNLIHLSIGNFKFALVDETTFLKIGKCNHGLALVQ